MFENIDINNFKSLSMENPLDLKPLTILCGSNSSGKSTLIQSILMLSQSFSSRFLGESLILNGHLVKLGSFSDILRHQSKNKSIDLSFKLKVSDEKPFYRRKNKILNCNLKFGISGKTPLRHEEEMHPTLLSATYILSEESDSGVITSDKLVFSLDTSTNNNNNSPTYKLTEYQSSDTKRLEFEYPGYKFNSVIYDYGLIPSNFMIEYDETKKRSYSIINRLISTDDFQSRNIFEDDIFLPNYFMNELLHTVYIERMSVEKTIIIPNGFYEIIQKEEEYKKIAKEQFENLFIENIMETQFSLDITDFPEEMLSSENIHINEWQAFLVNLDERKRKTLVELIDKHRSSLQDAWYKGTEKKINIEIFSSAIFHEIRDTLSLYFSRATKYLGPLRIDPQAIHSSFSRADQHDVGLKGEYTAALLHRNKHMVVRYPSPSYKDDELHWEIKHNSLAKACQDWLGFLGVIEAVNTVDKGKLGYELFVKTESNGKWQDLTHVGVGVSQVLPIILAFLLSNEDDILIFEQPELHLHPKIQSRLCDLFIVFASTKRQCILETHSEYIINRLRLRIAQDRSDEIKDNTALYFVSKNLGNSVFKKIEINRFGTIIEWPKNFFDQTDEEISKIMFEANKKSKEEKNITKKPNHFFDGWDS